MDIGKSLPSCEEAIRDGAQDGAAWHTPAKPEIIVERGRLGGDVARVMLDGLRLRRTARCADRHSMPAEPHIAPRDSFVNGTPRWEISPGPPAVVVYSRSTRTVALSARSGADAELPGVSRTTP
jgi:hypothetical protein